jgi:predicted Zn-dependent protease
MDSQAADRAQHEFEQAQQELDREQVLAALACLERALAIWDDARWHSRLAYCIAKERGHLTRAYELCRSAIAHDPGNPLHYLYQGKVLMIAGKTYEALQALRQGMAHGGSPDIERVLASIGTRKPPVLPPLSRNNPVNKYLGILLSRLKLR